MSDKKVSLSATVSAKIDPSLKVNLLKRASDLGVTVSELVSNCIVRGLSGDLHKSIQKENDLPLRQFFSYQHLPKDKQEVSKRFTELADYISDELPRNPETFACIRKLLEAKDCAVRSSFMK
ncbi:hypothetical protein [Aureispira sp. CCB-QB1]|uniref:hypothetical protein n=1 Tax=Aureispira sp. CCB-QB1 TaxID=1313421 RepID=UPI0018CC5A09|nr:hypothetical protein [Aureispira sp. CCB-QB1]